MQTLDAIFGVSATTGLTPTATVYAVVEANSRKLEQGCTVVLSLYGRQQFAKLMGQAFITEDGEAIEGIVWRMLLLSGVRRISLTVPTKMITRRCENAGVYLDVCQIIRVIFELLYLSEFVDECA